ncbi:radical SAM family heme chaperone HemW [Ureaplasma sp. OM1]|uniref:Heme chaperone HemW n=2 Tax=Ureaplasma ceti TaxID=3119530 RepID=A0ABP9U4K6_9BACT
MQNFVNDLIRQIQLTSVPHQYTTIYLGGGTPNHLPDDLLAKLLECLQQYLDDTNNYEFTIECNPDLVTQTQIDVYKKYGLNRVSLGAQILNNKTLKILRREHNADHIQQAIDLLYQNDLTNVSLDFIYNLPNETYADLDDIFNFVHKNNIKHVSFYALELKPNSIMTKSKYHLDLDKEEDQMEYIEQKFQELGYHRYEVSNWCLAPEYESQHNKCYWLSRDWKALGYGASGFEHQHSYVITNKIPEPVAEVEKVSDKDWYFQILMMGLRLSAGLPLNQEPYKAAYEFYKDRLINCQIVDGYLRVNNLDLLDDTLLALMD